MKNCTKINCLEIQLGTYLLKFHQNYNRTAQPKSNYGILCQKNEIWIDNKSRPGLRIGLDALQLCWFCYLETKKPRNSCSELISGIVASSQWVQEINILHLHLSPSSSPSNLWTFHQMNKTEIFSSLRIISNHMGENKVRS